MNIGRLIAVSLATLAIAGGAFYAAFPESRPALNFGAAVISEPPSTGSVASDTKRPAGGAARGANERGGGTIAVEAAPVRQATATGDVRAIGSLQSDESVQIASEIAGRISEIPFAEGQPVKAGDVIVKLDEALAKADLTDAQSRLALATANNDRTRTLSRSGYATGRSRDEAVSTFETSRAAVELAQTRLDKHTLKVPFDGIAGVRSVSVGAYIAIGAPIVNVEKIDTLKVDFKVPEIYLQKIKVGQKIDVTVDAIPEQSFEGEIYAINPQVDVNGRALSIRARLPNKDGLLRPGLFARILIKGLTSRNVTLVPESAVVPRGGEAFVYRIDNGKAVEALVKLGARADAEVEVLEGLNAPATVVTAGHQKLRNGAAIEVIAAPPAPAPEPIARQPDVAGRSG